MEEKWNNYWLYTFTKKVKLNKSKYALERYFVESAIVRYGKYPQLGTVGPNRKIVRKIVLKIMSGGPKSIVNYWVQALFEYRRSLLFLLSLIPKYAFWQLYENETGIKHCGCTCTLVWIFIIIYVKGILGWKMVWSGISLHIYASV